MEQSLAAEKIVLSSEEMQRHVRDNLCPDRILMVSFSGHIHCNISELTHLNASTQYIVYRKEKTQGNDKYLLIYNSS